MASAVDICNDALGRVGANPITSLDDNSTEAKECKKKFPTCRDLLLEEFDWRFATQRFALAAEVDEPVYEFGYAYTLPSQVMRVLAVTDGGGVPIEWQTEGRSVLTGTAGPLYLKAIVRADDPSTWPALFREALSYRLSAEVCVPLAGDKGLFQFLDAKAEMLAKRAQNRDGGQGRSRQTTVNEITSARH